MDKKQVFLSYSWDSDEHQEWVRKLADSLEEHAELHVVWDGYDLDSLADKNKFMESGIIDSVYVLVVATAKYKQKADKRIGGVGIETYMASAAHWDALKNEGRTKILIVLRERDAVPNYLAGHLYIDFTADENYAAAERALLDHLRDERKVARPPKRRTIVSEDGAYTFTKVEDLIRIGHTNRRAVVNAEQGTDFSGPNRIKYELWETKSPSIAYYLALATSINITQTTTHAIATLKTLGLHPADLTVLRPRAGRAEQHLIANLFQNAGLRTNVHEFTYKDYIWEFCIDESLKGVDPPSEIANYTDQSISYENEEGEIEYAQSARDLLVTLLQLSSSTTAHLVVAPGGMGKTSLCLAVAAKLHNRTDLRSSVVIIQAESIKRYVAENGVAAGRIDSIFHLYELYARYHHFDQVFDRNTFELAFLSGNLVVIIDGLDEFVSLFPETFNLETFLSSLAQFHRELGSSAVLLTTRNSQLLEAAQLEALAIERHELLGFDSSTCKAYLSRRFRRYSGGASIAARVLAQLAWISTRPNSPNT